MSDYTLTGPALSDLYQIWSYYDSVADEHIANRQIHQIYQRFELLSEHPYIGIDQSDFAPYLRSHSVPRSHYIIFYFPRHYGVEIVRVIDGRRDPSRWFE